MKLSEIGIFLILFLLTTQGAYPKVWRAGGEGKVLSIQQVLNLARDGDSILVGPGVHREGQIHIQKSISLLGEEGSVLDADGAAHDLILITADNVLIKGLELWDVGTSFLKEAAAIRVSQAENVHIHQNVIRHCFFGIYLEYTRHSSLVGNQLPGNAMKEATAGNGIHAWKCSHLLIEGNQISRHRDGIYFEFVDDSHIRDNHSHQNLRYGLHFMFSNRDEYRDNVFEHNGTGVAVMFSRHITMTGNTFRHNWGGASYGLLLKEISDGSIEYNHFQDNTIAILAEGANRLRMSKNQFLANGTAIDIKGNCLDNQLEENNFLSNTFEVVTNSRFSNNTFNRNYWSAYRGYDLDRDGTGDVPYRPVSLFGKIAHEIPSAHLLLHSVFVDILMAGEKLFPGITPELLIDLNPRMHPYAYDSD